MLWSRVSLTFSNQARASLVLGDHYKSFSQVISGIYRQDKRLIAWSLPLEEQLWAWWEARLLVSGQLVWAFVLWEPGKNKVFMVWNGGGCWACESVQNHLTWCCQRSPWCLWPLWEWRICWFCPLPMQVPHEGRMWGLEQVIVIVNIIFASLVWEGKSFKII